MYDEGDKSNKFNYDIGENSFLVDQTSIILTPYTAGLVRLDIRLIHYLVNHVLLPKKRNASHINISYIPPVWSLENKVEKNLIDDVIHHMMDSKKRNIILQYSELV